MVHVVIVVVVALQVVVGKVDRRLVVVVLLVVLVKWLFVVVNLFVVVVIVIDHVLPLVCQLVWLVCSRCHHLVPELRRGLLVDLVVLCLLSLASVLMVLMFVVPLLALPVCSVVVVELPVSVEHLLVYLVTIPIVLQGVLEELLDWIGAPLVDHLQEQHVELVQVGRPLW